MPSRLHRHYNLNHLHFITCSCYRRLPGLSDSRHRNFFLEILARLRQRYRFELVGYVIMPDHFHLLMGEPRIDDPSRVMQVLKQTVSRQVLGVLRKAGENPKAKRLLRQLGSSAHPGRIQFWERRFYDFNVWSEKKRLEKLEYMHNNPVKRGLVKNPADWPWSSFRFYYLSDTRMMEMDRIGSTKDLIKGQ